MFKLVYFALIALASVSLVNGAAILRSTPPSGWVSEIHENYGDYHTRCLAIGCQNKQNTQFFDDCCHPMKKGETLEKDRKSYCRPGNNTSTPAILSSSPPPVNVAEPSSPTPQPTPTSDGDYGNDGDDDDNNCEEDPEHSTDVPPSTSSPTPIPSESPSPSPTPSPSPSPAQSSSFTNNPEPSPSTGGGSDVHTGGYATWFSQNGVAGACGTVHSDDDLIAALDYRSYGDLGAKSEYCGQKIRVSWQGKTVDVIVADACPTCYNSASVDLSKAAFEALADLSVGELQDIMWEKI